MNILFTGGRAPATLDLVRAFHRAGHSVSMAESLRGHLSQPSNAIQANFVVPAPRRETEAFLFALKKIVEENQIDLLIPTCEEVFYTAMAHGELPVFTDPLEKLNQLHNKWLFFNSHTPDTMLIRSRDDLLRAFAQWRRLVLKPVYSRFAARTLILPPLQKALSTLTFDLPWIAQEYIEGQAYCTYSVCHNGHVTAHTTYPSRFTAGQGATIVFQHVEHPAIFEWVKSFVEGNQFTGQIAFDFIQTSAGKIYVLECNPRTTSGVHLLASNPRFAEAFLNPQMDCITPIDNHSYMLSTAMLIYGMPAAFKENNLRQWARVFFTSSDVMLDTKDPLPFLFQFKSLFAYLKLAREKNISPLEASTFDIEWNGENLRQP